jgi:protein-S-isoprenylcysteine O-methyltransferase Ste14
MARRPALGANRHAGRDDLAGEHRLGDLGQIMLFILFFIIWIADSFVFGYTDFAAGYLPLWLRLSTGIIVLGIAGSFAKAGLNLVFGETRETPAVIDTGVFGRVRHPIYLGSILLYLGLTIITLSLAAALLLLIIVTFYHYISRHEEKLLLAKYGSDYADYMSRVPMWFPRLRSR